MVSNDYGISACTAAELQAEGACAYGRGCPGGVTRRALAAGFVFSEDAWHFPNSPVSHAPRVGFSGYMACVGGDLGG